MIDMEICIDQIANMRVGSQFAEKPVVDFAAAQKFHHIITQMQRECTPDVIVVDPPRKGCDDALLATMVKMNPERIVYVSCDSATLARDLKWLEENGYKLVEATPCDMFGQSVHVETVVLMSRK